MESPVSLPKPAPLPTLCTGAIDFQATAPMEHQKCLSEMLHRLREKVDTDETCLTLIGMYIASELP